MSSYEIGTRCWYPDKKLGWIGGEITKHVVSEDGKHHLELTLDNEYSSSEQQEDAASGDDNNKIVKIVVNNLDENENENDIVGDESNAIKNPGATLPLLRNPPILESTEDLTSLSYLNEPAVLHAIKTRYAQLQIYTYSGIVLIATNPFDRVDQLYSQDMIQAYAGRRRGELEPHLFAIAEEAYRLMKNDKQNQTIVVSGESGAGKTVSAKYIMRYFATVEQSQNAEFNDDDHDALEMSETEKRILATNPIMEAFGNAKTIRNDNSSRFGKYLEILFDKNISIIGARMRTYLLERSRLVFQPKTERNYHIFYQLLSGLTPEEKTQLKLTSIQDYHYINQGGDDYTIKGVNDAEEYQITVDALSLVGISKETQFELFKILAALLHIGNIEVVKTRNDSSVKSDDPNLLTACELLGVDPYNFSRWIVKKQITTRSEKIMSNLSYQQALVAKDSVAKFIYSALFDWLVENINVVLCDPNIEDQVKSFIGVLDIYGFEHFEKNSFEQFCINYANEKLQQEFNQHVFKLEQEEYVKEKIEWSFIEFNDNQPCIDLIENKLGILSLLDEESRLPAGSDESWIQKLYQTLDKPPTNKVFSKPRFGQTKFVVKHYAHDVAYDVEGFIEKNRDTVSDGHLEVLKASTNETLKDVLGTIERNAAKIAEKEKQEQNENNNNAAKKRVVPVRTINRKPTLGSIFKASLIDLMKTINTTNVHYIRCIKPNEEKEAWKFDNLMVLSQLRACGVLETIRISCAGFPTRWTYDEFVLRYHLLTPSKFWTSLFSTDVSASDIKKLTKKILEYTKTEPKKYQLGLTKVFFKAGMLASLEKLRSDKLNTSIVKIQKNIRAKYYRKLYLQILDSIKFLQSYSAGFYTRKLIDMQIKTHLALLVQSQLRGSVVRGNVKDTLDSIIRLQSIVRMQVAKTQLLEKRRYDAAIEIQKRARAFKPRQKYIKNKKHTVVIQSLIRRKYAQRKLTKLRAEAESVNNLKEVSYQLENKVIQLSNSLALKIKENKELNLQITGLQESLQSNANLQEVLELERETHSKNINELNEKHTSRHSELQEKITAAKREMDDAKAEIDSLKSHKEELKKEVQDKLNELNGIKDQLTSSRTQNSDLQNEVNSLKDEIQRLQKSLTDSNAAAAAAVTAAGGTSRSVSTTASGLYKTSTSNTTLPHDDRRFSVAASSSNFIDSSSPTHNSVQNESADAESFDNRSINSVLSQINDELYKLFDDTKALNDEIVVGLLKGFKIPETGVAVELTRKEVLYPARILIIILSDMWRLGLTKQSEIFLAEVLSTIQKLVTGLKGDDLILKGAFWLTNVRELYSFVVFAENSILNDDAYNSGLNKDEYEEYVKLVAELKDDFDALSYNIYNIWVKKLQKDLEKKVVSAVVLSQSLPGFVAQENIAFLPKLFNQQQHYKMDDILTFLNNIYWSMKTYHVETEVFREVIMTLLRYINAVCFNDLIMKRNFLSWKRGLQLNYNVTRLEEWCKSHYIPQGTECLEQMLQAAKLLQLKKATIEDIKIIWEICSSLKPIQIQKLITQYAVADYEAPVPQEILNFIAERVKKEAASNDKSHGSDIFLTVNTGPFKDPYNSLETREFGKIEAYIPAWLNLPITRRIVELVTKHVSVQEQEMI
ncbi:probable Myosin-2 [Saccharomycodes ludwigii]|uniref:Probable Myosin-2 n=1 Tax=Saccharomycodes ludwigii TaxID=36035 RepID=A0A376B2D0_9ASCO|nr:hypothetical protein SCDLUD_000471 [Saccharomycodes ludwigii]KAH3902876.1 hypothetical protein SCDLUD_000471 [Saccharomycodes ludwigii]SSD58782.1 probable Myosin-2 [Saccharomycodes ludwigii]